MDDSTLDTSSDSFTTPSEASVHGTQPGNCTRLIWLAAVCGVVGQLLFSNDWCFYIVPSALLAALVFWIIVRSMPFMSRLDRPPLRYLGLALAVVIGLSCGAVFRVIPTWAFNEAFGIDQPEGIRDLRIWRHYEGGPGEHSLILEFVADEAAVRALTAALPSQSDRPPNVPHMEQLEREWRESRSWLAAYELFGGPGHAIGRRTWKRITPLHAPEIFYWDHGVNSTLLLWDRTLGRVVVLHSRG